MRMQLTGLSLAAVVAATPSLAGTDTFIATTDANRVRVAEGELLGFEKDGIATFRGIPYAKAERFMAPEAPDSWDGLRLAMNYGQNCPIPTQTRVSTDEQFNPHRYFPESEDCQFLNVWTPGLEADGNRPVLVFLHGGGFTNGSAIEGEGYDGANFAKLADTVVVTLNHRLNVLGALDLSAYGERYADSANTGMRDIVAALEWVQANIAAFGGDPQNVTIMGQSGGGGKVRFLMGAPEAAELFDKAIVMSGSANIAALPREVAEAVGERTVGNLGLTQETIGEIDEIPYEELLAAGNEALDEVEESGLASDISWRPNVDGTFMPGDPVSDGWAQYSADKPLLVGNVFDENATVIRNDNGALLADNWRNWDEARATEAIREIYGDDTDAAIAAWREGFPREELGRLALYDTRNRDGVVRAAEVKAGLNGAPVYAYSFGYKSPVLDGIAGAWHVADVPMALYNVDLIPQSFGGGEDARSMSYDVARAFAAFVRTGNPNHPGLPEWPAFTEENGATMVFDDHNWVGERHDQALLDIAFPE